MRAREPAIPTDPAYTYSAGNTCTVNVTFAPKYSWQPLWRGQPAQRFQRVIATAHIYGTGQGPQLVFPEKPRPSRRWEAALASHRRGGGRKRQRLCRRYSRQRGEGDAARLHLRLSCVMTAGRRLRLPYGVAVDGAGNVYVADQRQQRGEGDASRLCFLRLCHHAGRRLQRPPASRGRQRQRLCRRLRTTIAVKEMPPGCASSSCVTTLGGGFS